MITLQDCKDVYSIEQATLLIANKIAYGKSKGYSTSWDGQIYWEYACNLDREIRKIKSRLDNYQFKPCLLKEKRVKTKTRKLFISTWDDKIVETWLSRALNALLSEWFSKKSYSYRIEKININLCQRHIIGAVKKSSFFARRDITNFFYSINHQIMLDQLKELVDEQLFDMVSQKVKFDYYNTEGRFLNAAEGIPFGSPIACVLSNIHLTHIDKMMAAKPASYFRYADDFLLAGENPDDILDSASTLGEAIGLLGLQLNGRKSKNYAFTKHPGFEQVNRFKHLGLEYWNDGVVRLPIEKRRKIVNIVKRAITTIKPKLRKIEDLDERARYAVETINDILLKRIRYAAIVDYYLKHVEDETQLRNMDREIAELMISAILDKPFKKRDFKTIPFKKLRQLGLISFLHRSRLHKHGQLKVPFLSMYNAILFERHQEMIERKSERIGQIKLARKLREMKTQ
jgi:hypothetical protein